MGRASLATPSRALLFSAQARESAEQTVGALATAVDAVDTNTHDHSERVAEYAVVIARALGLSQERVSRLRVAGQLHDVGKIAVPESILLKPTRLTSSEFERMKKHSEEGKRIVSAIGMPEAARWIHHLHERWDGTGYPDGLCGEQIPLESRILAAADALDAMTTDRAYNQAKSAAEARREFLRAAGSHFDAEIAHRVAELLANGDLVPNGESPERDRGTL